MVVLVDRSIIPRSTFFYFGMIDFKSRFCIFCLPLSSPLVIKSKRETRLSTSFIKMGIPFRRARLKDGDNIGVIFLNNL